MAGMPSSHASQPPAPTGRSTARSTPVNKEWQPLRLAVVHKHGPYEIIDVSRFQPRAAATTPSHDCDASASSETVLGSLGHAGRSLPIDSHLKGYFANLGGTGGSDARVFSSR